MSRFTQLLGVILVVAVLGASANAVTTIEFGTWIPVQYEPIIEEFNRNNPDIEVRFGSISGVMTDYVQQALIRLATDDPMDVMMISFAWMGDFVSTGFLLDLQPLLDRHADEFDIDDVFPAALIQGRYDDKQLALGLQGGGYLPYVNEHLVAEAGLAITSDWTWREFLDVAVRLSRDTSGDGVPEIWGFHNPLSAEFATGLAMSQGSPFWKEGERRITVDTPEHASVVEFIREFVDRRASPLPGQTAAFEVEQVAIFNGHAPYGFLLKQQWNVPFEWSVYLYPAGSAGRAMAGGVHMVAIAKNSPKIEEAWRFVSYLTGPEVQARLGNSGAGIPLRRSVATEITSPSMRTFMESMPYLFRMYDRGSSGIAGSISRGLQDVVNGVLAPRAALSRIEAEVNAGLQR